MSNFVQQDGFLLFEDGHLFSGDLFFGQKSGIGEAVFNTSHSGYQEILSDPSYFGQVMTFTTPHIGNVGVNPEDYESNGIHVSGIVVKHLSTYFSNWRAKGGLLKWLEEFDVPVLVGADTRSITRFIRSHGAQRCGIFSSSVEIQNALDKITSSPTINGSYLADKVSTQKVLKFPPHVEESYFCRPTATGKGLSVALVDFGVKRSIIRELTSRGCEVTVFPHDVNGDQLLTEKYNGVLLSNGPGDPASAKHSIQTVKSLIGNIPIFGICYGHQILSIAAGYSTYKLDFGHRGGNHPVKRLEDGRIEITSQNHGFAVKDNPGIIEWETSHVNLNDFTVEGIRHKKHPIFSLQYHPESSPGPHDSTDYFNAFIKEMKNA